MKDIIDEHDILNLLSSVECEINKQFSRFKMTGILFLSDQKDADRVAVVIAIMASEKCREEAKIRSRCR